MQVREGDWKVAPLPADLQDRRVEITGPTDAKMVINALNRCRATRAAAPPRPPRAAGKALLARRFLFSQTRKRTREPEGGRPVRAS